jgi:hypothetical protein
MKSYTSESAITEIYDRDIQKIKMYGKIYGKITQ